MNRIDYWHIIRNCILGFRLSNKFTQDIDTINLIKRLIQYAKPHLTKIIFGFICMVLVAASTAASAKLLKPVINDIFLQQRGDLLLPITASIFLVFLCKGIFGYGESVLMTFVGQRIMADIQQELFKKVTNADLMFFYRIKSGDLVSRFINDINKLNNAITGTISSIGKDLLTLIFFILVMFDEDWKLSVFVFFIFPVAVLPMVKIGKKIRKNSNTAQEQSAELTVLLTQCFQGIRLIKSYCMEKYEQQKVFHVINSVFKRLFKVTKIKAINHPIMELLGGIAIASVILYGGSQVIAGQQTPGAFFTFIASLLMSYEPLKRLANLNANLQEQLAAANRIFDTMDQKENIVNDRSLPNLKVNSGAIEFNNVSFSYDRSNKVLYDINMKLKQGQKTALVGPSGGGKSTLVNLIPRFFEIDQGSITIDSHDIKSVNLESLRKSIALVSQEIVLFDDTIEENIRFGNKDATLHSIRHAAKLAAADEFINDLPEGYKTRVGEHGTSLSGGQRQRIAIARAFLKNSKILLMDEPTSALDSQSEQKVHQAMLKLMQGRTTVIIAHRLSTIIDADSIYFLDKGNIVDYGNHEYLLKNCKQYEDLCNAQFKNHLVTKKQSGNK